MLVKRDVASQRGINFADLMIVCLCGLSLAVTLVFVCVVPLSGHIAGSRDFVSYWATGHQLAAHANPYDSEMVKRIEHAAGLEGDGVLLMRNPPWTLPIAYPLGFIGLRVAAALWSLILIGCLLLSVHLIRGIYCLSNHRLHLLGLSFPPALICLIMGQTSIFALLGLVLFIRFHRSRPFMAGMSLWLCTIKPQLFLPFATALFVWCIVHRSYRLVAGVFSVMIASSTAAYFLAPSAWAAYLQMMQGPEIGRQFIPCLSDGLRFWLMPQATCLQYLPVVLCCIWAARFAWVRRHVWEWKDQGSIVMLVSLLSAPYCWLYDQGLAIPALLQGANCCRSRTYLAILAIAGLLIDFELLKFGITSPYFLWTAPVWLAWYLFAMASRSSIGVCPISDAVA